MRGPHEGYGGSLGGIYTYQGQQLTRSSLTCVCDECIFRALLRLCRQRDASHPRRGG